MWSNRALLAFFSLIVILAASAGAQTNYYVDPNGDNNGAGTEADPFETITYAIGQCADGDTIYVNEGTYPEAISFGSKAISIYSTDPTDWECVEATRINAGAATAVTIGSNNEGAVLCGFRVTTTAAYAIKSEPNSVPTISNNIAEDGTSAGIYFDDVSYGEITNNIVRDNTYGLKIYNCNDLTIKSNVIYSDPNSESTIVGVHFTGSEDIDLINNTIASTKHGLYFYGESNDGYDITNNILWDNTVGDIYQSATNMTVSYCCIEDGYAGATNIDDDPCFMDGDSHDYHLQSCSPCIDTGDPSGSYSGLYDIDGDGRDFGNEVDMGADESQCLFVNQTSGPYYSIASAISNAADGDIIILTEDTYDETVSFGAKEITIRSTNPDSWACVEATVIDPGSSSPVVAFSSGNDGAVLQGVTVKTTGAYAIQCLSASVATIVGNIVEDAGSAGIHCYSTSGGEIRNNIIRDNDYGIKCEGSSDVSIRSNLIYSDPTRVQTIIGIHFVTSEDIELINNTIADTQYGIYFYGGSNDGYDLTNNIVWDNTVDDLYSSATNMTVNYCCIEEGYTGGTGNIDSDPCFIDPSTHDYHLQSDSPCIDAGDSSGSYTSEEDIDINVRCSGTTADIGADESMYFVVDSTNGPYTTIQSAIDAASNSANRGSANASNTVIVTAETHTTDPVTVNDDFLNIELADGAEIVAAAGYDDEDCLFTLNDVDSFALSGQGWGSVLRMPQSEYTDPNETDPTRHAIKILGGKDITIDDLMIKDTGGDGIYMYLWNFADPTMPENVSISNVCIENISRNGIAVLGVENLSVEDCLIRNCGGDLGLGIDIEPEQKCSLHDISFSNCEFRNVGVAISMNYTNLFYTSANDPIDAVDLGYIDFESCYISDSKRGISVTHMYDDETEGTITFKNVTASDVDEGLFIYNKSSLSAAVVFEHCVLYNAGHSVDHPHPIYFYTGNNYISSPYKYCGDLDSVGNIYFNDYLIIDDHNREALGYIDGSGTSPDMEDITGYLYVDNSNITSDDRSDMISGITNNVNDNIDLDPNNIYDDGWTLVYNATQEEEYETIQSAINDANSADEIIVYPGTYAENVDLDGLACTLRNVDPWVEDLVEDTIVDPNNSSPVILCETGEDWATAIWGLTLRNGNYGVRCYSASPQIRRCIVEDNSSFGVYCSGSGDGPWLDGNTLRDNYYGIKVVDVTTVILDCLAYDNTSIGMHFTDSDESWVGNCTITENTYGIYEYSGGSPTVVNSIIWNNSTNDLYGTVSPTYSCFDNASGNGNIDSDPNFYAPASDDFSLDSGSPCIDAGDSDSVYTNLDIVGSDRIMGDDVDMGAYEYDPD